MELTQKIIDFASLQEEPFYIFDINIVKENYKRLKEGINKGEVFYAVKANSDKRILSTLVELGSSFDIASIGELDLMLSLGANPDKISYGNTIKKRKHIKYAYDKGIRIFVLDEFAELYKIADEAPNSKVFVRIQMGESDSDWPLTKKFGTNMEKAVDLMKEAKKIGLEPYGVSFHVGSQCYDKYIWKVAILKVMDIFDHLRAEGIQLRFINTGGGVPVKHVREIPDINDIMDVINETVAEDFVGYDDLIVAVEPGRSMVGNSAILVSNVILRSEKEKNDWLYLDVGVFHGLMETIQDFKYEIIIPNRKGEKKVFTLSGPTCDSVDTMYDEVYLPNDIEIEDKLFIINTGAYTTGYASNFNGIEPPKVYFLDEI